MGSEMCIRDRDMSEYMEKHSVSRLIGAPPGYVGYEEGGTLTEVIRRRPYQVVLFDEIEKAHEDIYNILLQVLDDGRLTDSKGNLVNFQNTIIVFTSNLGSEHYVSIDGSANKVKEEVLNQAKIFFRPEFINRLDELIVFDKLSYTEMEKIVNIQINELTKRLSDKKISLNFGHEVAEYLAKKGFDRTYGARPLARVIQRQVMDPLAEGIISGAIGEDEIVEIRIVEGRIVLNPNLPRAQLVN